MPAILELHDLVVAVPGGGRAQATAPLSLALGDTAVTVVSAGTRAATALARTVAGLAPPLSGRVLVGAHDVTALPPGARQIGYVPRAGALLPHLTARQNITYLVHRQESVHEIVRGWEAALVYQLELGPILDQRPHELTAQQRMRVALARAVVTLPEVLVFERPDRAPTGPLPDLLARVASPATPPPATVVFTESAAAFGLPAAYTVAVP